VWVRRTGTAGANGLGNVSNGYQKSLPHEDTGGAGRDIDATVTNNACSSRLGSREDKELLGPEREERSRAFVDVL